MYLYAVLLLSVALVQGNDLAGLQAQFGEWRLKRAPVSATAVGNYKYNDQLKNENWTYFETEKNITQTYLTELLSTPYTNLSQQNKDDYDIFRDTLSTYIDGYRWSGYGSLNAINFLEGLQTNIGYFPSIVPLNTRGDFENYVVRLQKLPEQLKQYLGNLQRAVALQHTYYNVSMLPVPDQIDNIIKANPEDFAYYSPLQGKLENNTDIPDSVKAKLRGDASDAIRTIMDTLMTLRDYINNTYIPNARPGVGANTLEDGDDYYKACLKWHLSLDVTPEYVHNKGLEEVERISSNMKKVMLKLGHQGTVKEFFDGLKNDSRFYYNTADEVVAAFQEVIFERINPKLPTLFNNLPELPLEIQPSPTDGPGGYYVSGPKDGSRPGVFYLNVFRPKEMLTVDFMALSLHEANPGHHFQISIQTTASIPTYRKNMDGNLYGAPFEFPFFTAYLEGWALYAEALGEEMNLYKDDYELMGRYGSEIFRACRLVVDTGLNYFGWSRERAIEYMLNYTAYGESSITIEVNRYITWPGQACSYKMGEIKIRELRSKAETELGDKFNIKDFHDTILRNGAMSLTVLERIVDQWISDVKMSAAGGTGTTCINGGCKPTVSPLILIIIMYSIVKLISFIRAN